MSDSVTCIIDTSVNFCYRVYTCISFFGYQGKEIDDSSVVRINFNDVDSLPRILNLLRKEFTAARRQLLTFNLYLLERKKSIQNNEYK